MISRPRKYSNDELSKMVSLVQAKTDGKGQMTVSDTRMARILSRAGYEVNSKYVERLRHTQGIDPLFRRKKGEPVVTGKVKISRK